MAATRTFEVLIAVYGTEEGAEEALDQLKQMRKDQIIDIVDGGVMVKEQESGKVEVKQLGLPSVKKGTKGGVIVGAIVGLIFPPTILAGAILGGAAGGLGAKLQKIHRKDKELDGFLQETGESLEPGSSAIIAVLEDRLVQTLVDGLEGYNKLLQHGLDAEEAAALEVETPA